MTQLTAIHSPGARTQHMNVLNHKARSVVHWVPGSKVQLDYQGNNSRHLEMAPPPSALSWTASKHPIYFISPLNFQVHVRNTPSLHTQYSRVSLRLHLEILPNSTYISQACESKGHQNMPSVIFYSLYKFPVWLIFLPLWLKPTNPPQPPQIKNKHTNRKQNHYCSVAVILFEEGRVLKLMCFRLQSSNVSGSTLECSSRAG